MPDAIACLWRFARFCWHREIRVRDAIVCRGDVALHEVSVEEDRASAMYEGRRIEVDIRVRPLPELE